MSAPRLARAAALLGAALLAPGCGDSSSPSSASPGATGAAPSGRAPSVLLVTLDTTRADHLGAYGDAAAQTPTLDALAARGLLFERAWSPAPLTLPSHASILTGLDPVEHGARDNTLYRVGDECLLLSEVLADRGWSTGAFVGSVILARKYGLAQGFQTYRGVAGAAAEVEPGAGRGHGDRPAAAVVDDALEWLDGLPLQTPFFAWVHLYDAHEPHQAPEPFASRAASAYDAEIAYADSQLGRLLEGLASRRRGEPLLVVVTADHGESLGEHGEPTHSLFVYDATQRVPLLVVLPDGSRAGERSAAPVGVTDIAPTILDVLGLPATLMPQASAPSLLASAAAADDERAIALETLAPFHEHHWQPLRGLVWHGLKLVDSSRPELYALADDPREEHDRAAEDPAGVEALRGRLAALLAAHPPLVGAEASEAPAAGAAELEQISALGYAGAAREGDPFDPALPLPRDRVELLAEQVAANDLLVKGLELLEPPAAGATGAAADPAARRAEAETLLGQARERLGKLFAAEPDDRQTALGLANLELALGRYEAAREPLERYALALPRDPRPRFPLAQVYAETGHVDWALAEMAKAVHLDPQFRAAYVWLADTHAQRGETGAAAWWLQQLEAATGRRPSAELAERIAALRGAAQRHGQPIAAPASAQVDDLTPEGRRPGR
jgi:arylsulfatase A-like enzyme